MLKLEEDSIFSVKEEEEGSEALEEVSDWRIGRCSLVLRRESSEKPRWTWCMAVVELENDLICVYPWRIGYENLMASPLSWIDSGEAMMNFVNFCNCLIFFSLLWIMMSLITSLISWGKLDVGGPDIRSLL